MFVDDTAELTTSATDLLLSLQAVLSVLVVVRYRTTQRMWTYLWAAIFGLLAICSGLGAAAHGLIMATGTQTAIWLIVYLLLGLLMALFALAATSKVWGHTVASRCLPFGLAIAVTFFCITQFWSDSFLLFVVYEAVSMLLALTLYAWCFWHRRAAGTGYLAAGVLVGLIAAVLETQPSLTFTLFDLQFNQHSVFHLVQMISLGLLTVGVHQTHQTALGNTLD